MHERLCYPFFLYLSSFISILLRLLLRLRRLRLLLLLLLLLLFFHSFIISLFLGWNQNQMLFIYEMFSFALSCDWIRAIKLGNLNIKIHFYQYQRHCGCHRRRHRCCTSKPLYLPNWLSSHFIRQFNYVILDKMIRS